MRKQLISFVHVIKFCKYHGQEGVSPNPLPPPPLRTPVIMCGLGFSTADGRHWTFEFWRSAFYFSWKRFVLRRSREQLLQDTQLLQFQ